MNNLPDDARHQVMRTASEMKIAAPPHPNGEERELVGCKSEVGVTVFATLCHADADLANAAKFLDRVFHVGVRDGLSYGELLLENKIRFAVVCDKMPDRRLVDKFAKQPIPVHVVDVGGYANILKTGGPQIPLTEETKERVVKEMECAARPVTTSVDEATWNAMVASLEATPKRKRKTWKFVLHGSDGSSTVKYINGNFVDHNAVTGAPQVVKKFKFNPADRYEPQTARGAAFVARHAIEHLFGA